MGAYDLLAQLPLNVQCGIVNISLRESSSHFVSCKGGHYSPRAAEKLKRDTDGECLAWSLGHSKRSELGTV